MEKAIVAVTVSPEKRISISEACRVLKVNLNNFKASGLSTPFTFVHNDYLSTIVAQTIILILFGNKTNLVTEVKHVGLRRRKMTQKLQLKNCKSRFRRQLYKR